MMLVGICGKWHTQKIHKSDKKNRNAFNRNQVMEEITLGTSQNIFTSSLKLDKIPSQKVQTKVVTNMKNSNNNNK